MYNNSLTDSIFGYKSAPFSSFEAIYVNKTDNFENICGLEPFYTKPPVCITRNTLHEHTCRRLHVHLAPLTPVGRRRLPLVRAGHAAAGTAAASAVVLVGVGSR